MVTRDSVGSWLEGGPGGSDDAGGPARGARLGLPATGPGSLARLGRRVVALCVDWVACLAVSALLLPAGTDGVYLLRGDSLGTLGVFALMNLVLVATLGHTLGHRLLGLQVRRAPTPPPDERSQVASRPPGLVAAPGLVAPPGLVAALVRTVLLCLVLPAVVWDGDGRGLHDRAAGTVLVRR